MTTACENLAHLFLYTAGPKVKPLVKKEDSRLRAILYWCEAIRTYGPLYSFSIHSSHKDSLIYT
jgi:hypothetical protein